MNMQFINGFLFGSGFVSAAILITVLSHKLFGVGVCG